MEVSGFINDHNRIKCAACHTTVLPCPRATAEYLANCPKARALRFATNTRQSAILTGTDSETAPGVSLRPSLALLRHYTKGGFDAC